MKDLENRLKAASEIKRLEDEGINVNALKKSIKKKKANKPFIK